MTTRLIAVLVVGTALLAGCSSGGQSEPVPTTTGVNFSGSGKATLAVAGTSYMFDAACESTEADAAGRLLVSGSGVGPSGAPVSVSVDLSLSERTGTMGANLGGDPPQVVQAETSTVDLGPPLVVTGRFGEVGEATLTVDGCSPSS